jgi:DNA-binding protein H-NS
MVGIYKITNNINQHCYIGQSKHIKRRWNEHKNAAFNEADKSYDYPLYRSFRKYGLENFTFEVIEECSIEELNEKEIYWIDYYKPVYNQTLGGDAASVPQKLTLKQVDEIQQILINDPDGKVSHKELAEKYNVHKDTIRDINVGRTWFNDNYTYPLHLTKFDPRKEKIKYYCIDCGKEIWKGSIRCPECNSKNSKIPLEKMPVTREELKDLIRTIPFTTIASQYGVSDRAVAKWCIKLNLPSKKKIINTYSDKEW